MLFCRGILKCPLLGGVRYWEVSVKGSFTVVVKVIHLRQLVTVESLSFLVIPRKMIPVLNVAAAGAGLLKTLGKNIYSTWNQYDEKDDRVYCVLCRSMCESNRLPQGM